MFSLIYASTNAGDLRRSWLCPWFDGAHYDVIVIVPQAMNHILVAMHKFAQSKLLLESLFGKLHNLISLNCCSSGWWLIMWNGPWLRWWSVIDSPLNWISWLPRYTVHFNSNALKPDPNCRHFADDITLAFSWKRRYRRQTRGDKALSHPLLESICVTGSYNISDRQSIYRIFGSLDLIPFKALNDLSDLGRYRGERMSALGATSWMDT